MSHPWFEADAPPVILGAGRLGQAKDFPTLIRAFARVRQKRPARLMILGEAKGTKKTAKRQGRLMALAREADLLICEAARPDEDPVRGHLTPSLAGRMATEAGVRRLMLTHFYPDCENVDLVAQCRRTYAGPVLLARDLMTLKVT
mgnify:CR=1 FL=1